MVVILQASAMAVMMTGGGSGARRFAPTVIMTVLLYDGEDGALQQ